MGFSDVGKTSLKNNTNLREGINFFGIRKELTLGGKIEKLEGKSDLPIQRKREVVYRKNIRLAAEIIFYSAGIGMFLYYGFQLFQS